MVNVNLFKHSFCTFFYGQVSQSSLILQKSTTVFISLSSHMFHSLFSSLSLLIYISLLCYFVSLSLLKHHLTDIDMLSSRSLSQSHALWAHNLWRMFCVGFRHSAGFHARVVLDGAACRLGDLGEVDYVPGVLGVDRVVPIVVRVLVS